MATNPKIGAIVYRVSDIKRSEKFYRDVLGLSVRVLPLEGHEEEEGHEGDSFMMADVGDITLVFFQGKDKPGKTPIVVFSLEDGGIDAVIQGLVAKGVTLVTPVSEAPGGWSADWLDPDGHVWSHYQSNTKPR